MKPTPESKVTAHVTLQLSPQDRALLTRAVEAMEAMSTPRATNSSHGGIQTPVRSFGDGSLGDV